MAAPSSYCTAPSGAAAQPAKILPAQVKGLAIRVPWPPKIFWVAVSSVPLLAWKVTTRASPAEKPRR